MKHPTKSQLTKLLLLFLVTSNVFASKPTKESLELLNICKKEKLNSKDFEKIKDLINKGANPNAQGDDDHTSLHSFYFQGDYEIAEFLINNKADINAQDNDGATALHFTCFLRNKKMAAFLINKGANVNAQGNNGETSLHITCFQRDYKIAVLLINKGADVNAQRDNGETPLHYTSRQGDYKIAVLLINNGAGVNAPADNGETPLDVARKKGHLKVVEILKKEYEKKLKNPKTEEKEEIKKEKEKTNNLIASNPYLKNSPYKKSIAKKNTKLLKPKNPIHKKSRRKKNKKPLKPKKTITVSLQLFDKEDPSLYEKMLKKKTNDQGFEFNPNYNLTVDSKTPLRKIKSMLSEQIKGSIDSIYFQLFLPGKNNKWIRVKKGDNNKLYSPLSSLMDKNENNKVIKIKYKIAYWIQFYAHTFLKKLN